MEEGGGARAPSLPPSLPRPPYGPGLLLMLAAHSHRGPGGACGALQIRVGPAEVACGSRHRQAV